jgi:hypothetical protein
MTADDVRDLRRDLTEWIRRADEANVETMIVRVDVLRRCLAATLERLAAEREQIRKEALQEAQSRFANLSFGPYRHPNDALQELIDSGAA